MSCQAWSRWIYYFWHVGQPILWKELSKNTKAALFFLESYFSCLDKNPQWFPFFFHSFHSFFRILYWHSKHKLPIFSSLPWWTFWSNLGKSLKNALVMPIQFCNDMVKKNPDDDFNGRKIAQSGIILSSLPSENHFRITLLTTHCGTTFQVVANNVCY